VLLTRDLEASMASRSRILRRGLIGALALAAGGAAPAAATPPGLTRVVETYAVGTDVWRYDSARCPEGTAALSAGYEWIGGGNDIRLSELQYTWPPIMVYVRAHAGPDGVDPTAAYGSAWGMRVHLICAVPPARHQNAYNNPFGFDDSTDLKTSAVRCPAGTNVYGVGGGVHWSDRLVIDENWTPNATLTSASVSAQEDEVGTSDPWRVWVQAICAEPLPGLQRVAATSVGGSASAKEVTATCPAPKRLVGMGGDIRRAHGEVVMTALVPSADLTSVRLAAREDDTGTLANWYATAYAICAS
jgi:hypothetical protein